MSAKRQLLVYATIFFAIGTAAAKAEGNVVLLGSKDILSANEPASRGSTLNLNATAKPPAPASVFVVEQSLPDFLRQAARRSGYQITISQKVRGTLRKLSLPLDINEIMPQIADQFDLEWHAQKEQIYVSTGSETTTKLVYLGKLDPKTLDSALEAAGIVPGNARMTFVEESNSVIVNGPAQYIASIELLTESFNKNEEERLGRIKVIRFGNVGK